MAQLPAYSAPDKHARAYLITHEIPPGTTVHHVDDRRHLPHLRPGDAALIDTNDRAISYATGWFREGETQ